MFNSPLAYCAVCGRFVALDEPYEECARQNRCQVRICPLRAMFRPSPSTEVPEAAVPPLAGHSTAC